MSGAGKIIQRTLSNPKQTIRTVSDPTLISQTRQVFSPNSDQNMAVLFGYDAKEIAAQKAAAEAEAARQEEQVNAQIAAQNKATEAAAQSARDQLASNQAAAESQLARNAAAQAAREQQAAANSNSQEDQTDVTTGGNRQRSRTSYRASSRPITL